MVKCSFTNQVVVGSNPVAVTETSAETSGTHNTAQSFGQFGHLGLVFIYELSGCGLESPLLSVDNFTLPFVSLLMWKV